MNTLVVGDLKGVAPELPRWPGHFYEAVYDPAALGAALIESGAETVVWAPPRDVLVASRTGYALAVAAADVGVRRIVLVSSLELFSRLSEGFRIDEDWRPCPDVYYNHSLPLWLAELSLREIVRATNLRATVLRLGVASPEELDWALHQALADTERWKIRHVGEIPNRGRGIRASALYDTPRSIRKIAVLGAGGPLGAALIDELKDDYTLRLADIRPLSESVSQGGSAPVPVFPGSPHEEVFCDVRDQRSVREACRGCDAIVNLSVIRDRFEDVFAVNTLGAWNVGDAARRTGIFRVVQTGPQLVTLHGENDYSWDWDVSSDPPPRPGRHLYGHSKFLGQEALRIQAEVCGLEVAVLLFNHFVAETDRGVSPSPMMLTWRDSARAIRAALEAPSLPSPYEVFHCCVDFPVRRMRADKARWLLGWEPQDRLENAYRSGGDL